MSSAHVGPDQPLLPTRLGPANTIYGAVCVCPMCPSMHTGGDYSDRSSPFDCCSFKLWRISQMSTKRILCLKKKIVRDFTSLLSVVTRTGYDVVVCRCFVSYNTLLTM
ncbi:hypothetical protein NP493_525g06067 [Ridgeia piscesae]|uniref:Uncharacterized protein n=1 Tax=Ridgeia piscesae TaxID=27915 RepID=A0AAD9KWY3_RIDPI|nr:hypothetical protein NP493_525g06067 [Ridgeia piscesae]